MTRRLTPVERRGLLVLLAEKRAEAKKATDRARWAKSGDGRKRDAALK